MGNEWQYGDVWDAIAEVRGDATALIHGDTHRSWRDFSNRADSLALSLVEGGAHQGDRVAQYLYNSPEYLEVSYATYKAGLTPVNTNYRYRAEELAYLWTNADAIAVVFHGSFAETIETVRNQVPTVKRWLWVDDDSTPCPTWAEPYEQVVTARSDAYYQPPWGRSGDDIVMIYTGGTTGMPKGVMWRHHDMYQAFNAIGDPEYADLDYVKQRLSGRSVGPVGLPASPLMHATGYMFAKSMLTQGGTVVTLTNRSFDAAGLLDVIAHNKVEAMAMVGDTFGQPILAALDANPGHWDLSSLSMLVSAGVMWSAQTKTGLASHLPTTLLVDLLGSTEAHNLGSAVAGSADGATTAQFKLGPHAMVVTEDKKMAQPGESGLLAVGGPMPLGYFKDDDKTAKTFWTVEGKRVSVPGDWARLEADGSITLLGRGSLCINTGGEKVFPEEVEEAIETHPSVFDSTVIGIPDARFGESIAAEVELNPGATVTTEELIAHVKTQLAGYKAPRYVSIVDSVGRLPNGKADYGGVRTRMIASLDSSSNNPSTS